MAQFCPLGRETSQQAGERRLCFKYSLTPGRAESTPEGHTAGRDCGSHLANAPGTGSVAGSAPHGLRRWPWTLGSIVQGGHECLAAPQSAWPQLSLETGSRLPSEDRLSFPPFLLLLSSFFSFFLFSFSSFLYHLLFLSKLFLVEQL